jgi:hypothetical protein
MALISTTVSLRAPNGQWWRIEKDTRVSATAPTLEKAEKFNLIPVPFDSSRKVINYALFSTSLKKYLSRISHPGKDYIEAAKDVIDPYSQFLMDPFQPSRDPNSISSLLQADNQLFLQVDSTDLSVRPIGEYSSNPANAHTMESLIAWLD